MKDKDYGEIRLRKARQDRGLIKSIEEKHNALKEKTDICITANCDD